MNVSKINGESSTAVYLDRAENDVPRNATHQNWEMLFQYSFLTLLQVCSHDDRFTTDKRE